MELLATIIFATLISSAGSFTGAVTFAIKPKRLDQILLLLVSFSAGTLMGETFIHILPEASEVLPIDQVSLITLLGFVFFFLIEKFLFWRHCHEGHCHVHHFGVMSLIGDSVHNFIDGLILAATFVTNPGLGIATTIAIATHEIPQEIGDFAVLLYSGFSKKKALLANVSVAMTSVLGGIIGFYIAGISDQFVNYLLPFAAGGFLYIAASDLLPELKKETNRNKSIFSTLLYFAGILMMYLIKG